MQLLVSATLRTIFWSLNSDDNGQRGGSMAHETLIPKPSKQTNRYIYHKVVGTVSQHIDQVVLW